MGIGKVLNENGTTPYSPDNEMTLLREMMQMPDCNPTLLHGGGTTQPWVVPVYGMGAEVELQDWLYAFIRLIRPQVVAECGSHRGFTTWAMARALQDVGHGVIHACDTDKEMFLLTLNRCVGLPAVVYHESVLSDHFKEILAHSDFVFLDSDEGTRPEAYSCIKQGALVVIHDTKDEPGLLEGLNAQQQTARVDVTETWRGFSILRKL